MGSIPWEIKSIKKKILDFLNIKILIFRILLISYEILVTFNKRFKITEIKAITEMSKQPGYTHFKST